MMDSHLCLDTSSPSSIFTKALLSCSVERSLVLLQTEYGNQELTIHRPYKYTLVSEYVKRVHALYIVSMMH
jgi:hypothetical protein